MLFLSLIWCCCLLVAIAGVWDKSSYELHPFYLEDVFVIVVEEVPKNETEYVLHSYPFGKSKSFMLSFGDFDDMEKIMSQDEQYIQWQIMNNQCYCSRTLALSLVYMDLLLSGNIRTASAEPYCQPTFLINATHRELEVFSERFVVTFLASMQKDRKDCVRSLCFLSLPYPQKFVMDEFDSHRFDENIPVATRYTTNSQSPECLFMNLNMVHIRSLEIFFSSYHIPRCAYKREYCCFLLRQGFKDVAKESLCAYHPPWVESRAGRLPLDYVVQDKWSYNTEDPLMKSATGKFFYLEEEVDKMQKRNASLKRSIQSGMVDKYNSSYSTQTISVQSVSELVNRSNSFCFFFPVIGLVEFIDIGPNPLPHFQNQYIHKAAPPEVVGVSHFATLDAYGAYFQNGELFVHFSSGTPSEQLGFKTIDDEYKNVMDIYFEASSFGLGLNDSKSLSPPLKIHAVRSPIKQSIQKDNVTTTLISLWDKLKLFSTSLSSMEVALPGNLCSCKEVKSGVHVILGVVNNPYYGHVLTNTLSNLFATLFLKNINPKKVTLHLQLQRQGHHQIWDDRLTDILRAIGIPVVYINEESSMLFTSKHIEPMALYCIERVIVGSAPLLDNLNRTISHKTGRLAALDLWKLFGSTVANSLVSPKKKLSFVNKAMLSSRGVAVPLSCSQCAVTFISRHENKGRFSSRAISNIQELEEISRNLGCTTQVLLLHTMPVSEQIAQLRYNTSLLVGADGTGLLNAVWMHECSSVLRINMWRKKGIVNRLSQGLWFEYKPKHNETVFYPFGLSSEDEGYSLEDQQFVNELKRTGRVLTSIKRLVYANVTMEDRHFNFSGANKMKDIWIEHFFREGQSIEVNPSTFLEVLIESETFRRNYLSGF